MGEMVALVGLPYPFATFISYKAHKVPRNMVVQSSIQVPYSSSLRRAKRKNYLRPKILKTLTKPYNVPLEDPIPAPIQPIERNDEVPLEDLGSDFVEELEMESGVNESDLSQLEVVKSSEGQNLVGFGGLSGHTVFRVVGSFVGLFVLQSLASVWVMGYGNSDGKDGSSVIGDRKKDVGLGMGGGEVGIDRNSLLKNLVGVDVVESEMEAKISEIRKMAWEVREAEKRKKVEDGVTDVNDTIDDDSEEFEDDDSRINSGIVKEVDVRLSKLKKRYTVPSLNVNLMNKSGGPGKEGKDEVLYGEREDNMLLFEKKHKFRSHLTTFEGKLKGYQSIDGVREMHSNMDDGKSIEKTGSNNDMDQIMNVLETTITEKHNNGMDKEEKKPVSQSSAPLKGSRKGFGSNGAKKKLDKRINGSTALRSDETTKMVGKGRKVGANPDKGSSTPGSNGTAKNSSSKMIEGTKPERGLIQDSSGNILDEGAGVKMSSSIAAQDKRKTNDYVISTTSVTLTMPRRNDHWSIDKDELENVDPWWSKLPYVFVILLQNGIGSEAQRGFYKISIYNDAVNLSDISYSVAFQDRNDARNFSYLLETAFEDLPEAAVDIAPLSIEDFKEVAETLDNKVFVIRKGELKLYAGQPLADVEATLRSMVK